MTLFMKHFTIAGLVALITLMTGCVKMKQTLTVMPDGAGKIEINIGMSEQMIAMAKQSGEDPFEDLDPKELAKNSKGIVAFTKPVKKQEGGYTYIRFAAYFEDINKVEMSGPEGEDVSTFSYKRTGATAMLSTDNSFIIQGANEYEPIPEEQKQFMAGMMAGISMVESYVLPGEFEDIKGVTAVDNTANIEMTLDHLMNGNGPIADFKGVEKLSFKISGIKDDKAKADAFKKELDAAVAEWEKIKKEAAE